MIIIIIIIIHVELTHASNEFELFLCKTLVDNLLDKFHQNVVVHVLQVSTDRQLTVSELDQMRDLFTNVAFKLIHYLLHTRYSST